MGTALDGTGVSATVGPHVAGVGCICRLSVRVGLVADYFGGGVVVTYVRVTLGVRTVGVELVDVGQRR